MIGCPEMGRSRLENRRRVIWRSKDKYTQVSSAWESGTVLGSERYTGR